MILDINVIVVLNIIILHWLHLCDFLVVANKKLETNTSYWLSPNTSITPLDSGKRDTALKRLGLVGRERDGASRVL